MMELTCLEAAKACGGIFYGTDKEGGRRIAGVERDSRKIEKDWLFVATVGERVDGHSYIPQVFEKQAACAVSEKLLNPAPGPYIYVKDSLQALKEIAAYDRSKFTAKVIGITGSVGKTSTKEMIASVLGVKYQTAKTKGNYNNEVGVPLTLLSVSEKDEMAVVEMGISDFGEMHRLGKMARPDLMVITNIGQCHLENLKTRDGILKAKTEVFDEMDEKAGVVLNMDDDKLRTISSVHGKKPYFFSKNNKEADAYATDVENLGLYGSSCVIHIGKESVKVHVPLPGEHMVLNAIAAALTGHLAGLTMEEIAEGIARAEAVDGRGRRIQTECYTLLDECYNANPGSMRAALDLLALANTRKAAVLGDMFELGENTEELHRQTGAYAAEKGIDVIICIGALAAYMADGAKQAGAKEVYLFADQKTFLEKEKQILKTGDSVLLKASHGMHFEDLLKVLQTEA